MEIDDLVTHRVDHLAMVAQFIDDIGMVDIIDSITGIHPNEVLTTGQAAASMVVMALGFVSRPLYLSPQFFTSKALSLIVGKSRTGRTSEFLPEHFNDDKLGRTLDEIYAVGPDTLFQTVAFAAARLEKLTVPSLHEDTTTHSFYGMYDGDTAKGISGRADCGEPCHATVEYGFSKDKREDCKQLVQELLVSSDGDVPLMVKVHSGNESDTKIFQERIRELRKQFEAADDLMPKFIVADCKFYNEKNVKECADIDKPRWITRVPDSVSEVGECFLKAYRNPDGWRIAPNPTGKGGVNVQDFRVLRYGIEQRFIVVVSDASLSRAEKSQARKIKDEAGRLEKAVKKMSKVSFACESDAEAAAKELTVGARYHRYSGVDMCSSAVRKGRGRPRADDDVKHEFHATARFEETDSKDRDFWLWHDAVFVVGTNDLAAPAEDIVSIYRKDQQGVERAFRFLKSPTYFADAFFFKNTKRIVALITLMTISLLVYSLLQRKLRRALEAQDDSVPNQVNKPTKRPTMNWVNQCFEGIDLICHRGSHGIRYVFVRLSPFAQKVLRLLGPQYVRRYSAVMLE
jgi:transposase